MAPKEKRDPAWVHCQLIDGKMVCNYCQKEVGKGGIHRIKQQLEHANGNVKPCLKVSNDLKSKMFSLFESYQAEKSKHTKIQSEIGRSSTQMKNRERIPSFEESSSFPIPLHDPYTSPREKRHPREEEVVGGNSSKMACGNHPTIDAKWKKMEREVVWECIVRW
jgi:hypothetical protein